MRGPGAGRARPRRWERTRRRERRSRPSSGQVYGPENGGGGPGPWSLLRAASDGRRLGGPLLAQATDEIRDVGDLLLEVALPLLQELQEILCRGNSTQAPPGVSPVLVS